MHPVCLPPGLRSSEQLARLALNGLTSTDPPRALALAWVSLPVFVTTCPGGPCDIGSCSLERDWLGALGRGVGGELEMRGSTTWLLSVQGRPAALKLGAPCQHDHIVLRR